MTAPIMIHVIPPVFLATLTTLSFVLSQISSETKVPLGEAVAGFIFIAGLVWWLGRRLQKIEDRLVKFEEDLNKRPCQMGNGNCNIEQDDDDESDDVLGDRPRRRR